MRQAASPPRFAALIGVSPAIAAVRDRVDRLAASDASVLVTGPSGSGKEVVADLLHQRGGRAAKPFVAVNCAAVPRDLIESEIFGHAAGAFTGATHARRGRFELADGGTLFLDEVGDMPPEFQAKLLRVLETRAVERVGGTAALPVDVRVIAATNADLPAAIAAGRFRADLFYRLAVVEIALPALTERREDIPLLIEHFAATLGEGARRPHFAPSAVVYLARQDWPGNVRELRNFVARTAALHPGGTIEDALAAVLLHGERRQVDHWLSAAASPMPHRRRPPPIVAAGEVIDLKALLDDFEQAYIREVLGRTEFAVAESARLLGLRRTTLVEKMRRLNIARP